MKLNLLDGCDALKHVQVLVTLFNICSILVQIFKDKILKI